MHAFVGRRLALVFALAALGTLGGACRKEGVTFMSVNPTSGRGSGNEEVRVRGHGFRSLGGMEVRIGGRVAKNVGIADDDTLVLSTPECPENLQGRPLDLTILTNDGRSWRIRDVFTFRRQADPTSGNNDLQRRL